MARPFFVVLRIWVGVLLFLGKKYVTYTIKSTEQCSSVLLGYLLLNRSRK